MATFTVKEQEARLTLIKATVATGDKITNNTGANMELCSVVEVTTGSKKTLSYDAKLAYIKPGEQYTVLSAQNGKPIYAVGLQDNILSTVPKITVS